MRYIWSDQWIALECASQIVRMFGFKPTNPLLSVDLANDSLVVQEGDVLVTVPMRLRGLSIDVNEMQERLQWEVILPQLLPNGL